MRFIKRLMEIKELQLEALIVEMDWRKEMLKGIYCIQNSNIEILNELKGGKNGKRKM